jgi:hypothetical protein
MNQEFNTINEKERHRPWWLWAGWEAGAPFHRRTKWINHY